MRANLMKRGSHDGLSLDEKKLEELFETHLRPMKSRNARTLFRLFLGSKGVEYLTTLDLQIKLSELGLKLNKKEINGWLCSLQNAGLIVKEEERGKPTTITYDDKYTFDMWRLTSKGLEIEEGINHLIGSKASSPEIPFFDLEDIASMEEGTRIRILSQIEETYVQLAMLRCLSMAGGILTRIEMGSRITTQHSALEKMIAKSRDQGLISETISPKKTGLISRFLRLLGLSKGGDVSIHLSKEGKRLVEKF